MHLITILLLPLLLLACASRPAPIQAGTRKRVVVLALHNPAKLTPQEVGYITDLVRSTATALPPARFQVLTRENLVQLLGPGMDLAEACAGDCEIETGRRIGADYLVTGEVVRFGEALRVVLNLYDTRTAALLVSTRASARVIAGLERTVQEAGRALFARLAPAGARAEQPVDAGRYVRIEPGEFMAGSPANEPGRRRHEARNHVRIGRAYLMKSTEVTQGEWRALMGTDPSRFDGCGHDCPVERVNWFDAVAWLNAASAAEGLTACYAAKGCKGTPGAGDYVCAQVRSVGGCDGYRLPTRAEWGYAARAGAKGALPSGAMRRLGRYNAPELDRFAWYGGNSAVTYPGGAPCGGWVERQYPADRCGPHPVGRKAANAWGLLDMLGNVAEWTETGTGGGASGVRWHRGGAWRSPAAAARLAAMAQAAPTLRDAAVGFRPVRTAR
jgi:formylglycine-generating enzyme required for sulfatase activity